MRTLKFYILGLACALNSPQDLSAQELTASTRWLQEIGEGEGGVAAAPLRAPAISEQEGVAAALTLEDLESLALAYNPTLGLAQAQVDAAQGRWVQAGLPPNPMIGYAGEEMGANGTAGMQGFFIGQQIITAHKNRLDRAVVAQEIQQAAQQLEAQRLRVLTDVRVAFAVALAAQRQLDVTEELVRVSDETVETIAKLEQALQRSRVELLQSQIEAEAAHVLLGTARQEYAGAWRRMVSLAGVPQMPPARLIGEIEELPDERQWSAALDRIIQENPVVAAAFANIERASWAIERAYAERIPDINVQVMLQHDNGIGDQVTSVQVGFPLPLWNKNQGGIQAAEAEFRVARQQAAQVELELAFQLASVYQRYANARQQVVRYSESILPNAREALDLVREGYTAGQLDYLNLLTAQRTFFQSTLAYVDALGDLRAAEAELEGLLLTGSLE